MDTRLPSKPERHEMLFEPGELTLIKERSNGALSQAFRDMMARKLRGILVRRHVHASSENIEIYGLELRDDVPKTWGRMLEVLYRVKGKRGSYRHVFHFVLQNGEQSGWLYTQTWQFTAQ